jgi:ABC-type multidrug transport system fused ATPase/permease subunit
VKLFSQGEREAGFARAAMQDFMRTVYRQMRLASSFEIVNHTLSMLLIACTAGAALWRWSEGEVSIGAVAAATAMALRLNGISHWIMWEMSNLFEHIGTVQDGISTLSTPVRVTDRADASAWLVAEHREQLDRLIASLADAPAFNPRAPQVARQNIPTLAARRLQQAREVRRLGGSQGKQIRGMGERKGVH